MSLALEIILIVIMASIFVAFSTMGMVSAFCIFLQTVLTGVGVLYIILYILAVNVELEKLSVNPVLNKTAMGLLVVSKMNRNFIIVAFVAILIKAVMLTVGSTNIFMFVLYILFGYSFAFAVCFLFIFISNKVDAYSIKYFSKKYLIPIAGLNILISRMIFSIIQSFIAFFRESNEAAQVLFSNIPLVSNLFDEPVLFNYIYDLFLQSK